MPIAINVLTALLLTACAPFPQRVADELEPTASVVRNNFAPSEDLAVTSDKATAKPVGDGE